MNFEWAEPYPEVRKVCVLFNLSELSAPLKWHYYPLRQHLQSGPQCGLVALAMIMGDPSEESIDNMFKFAKKMRYTNNGEMFSVDFMFKLAKKFLIHKNVELYAGSLSDNKIKEYLLAGAQMLVPYDSNKDNSPGLHFGHKAHWCAISGAVSTEEDFFVLARHGKARNVAVWRLENLARSNEQLMEFSPDRNLHDVDYILPDGGLSGPLGLNKKSILVSET